jgi:hypothetical protein
MLAVMPPPNLSCCGGQRLTRPQCPSFERRYWQSIQEDLIREKEAAGDFGPGFIDLARSVYRENDERARIKRALNQKLRSVLVEEKQYLAY